MFVAQQFGQLLRLYCGDIYKLSYIITLVSFIFFFRFRNAMLKSICEVLDLERSGVNSELVKRILNFLMNPKPSGKVRTNLYNFSNKSIIYSLSFLIILLKMVVHEKSSYLRSQFNSASLFLEKTSEFQFVAKVILLVPPILLHRYFKNMYSKVQSKYSQYLLLHQRHLK